jgi:serine/threonine-protein kinase
VSDFGRYHLERKLGQGGMAEVFLARQEAAAGAGRQVVIKRILPAFAEQPDFLKLFVGEARLSMQLSHGNVVQVFDFGDVDGQYFLSMEFVDGLTLGSLLDVALAKGLGGLPAPVAAIIGIELCKALHYAHLKADQHGQPLHVVHRDISPENVLISWEGQVKLSDFGIARAVMEGRERTRPDVFRGRLDFCAPEQARAEPVDARTDLYSLGVLLTTMVLGTNPVAPIALRIASGSASVPPFPPSAVDEGFAAIVDRCTARVPGDRHADAQAVHTALQRWLVTNASSKSVSALPTMLAWVKPAEVARRGLPTADPSVVEWLSAWRPRHGLEREQRPLGNEEPTMVTRRPEPPRPLAATRLEPLVVTTPEEPVTLRDTDPGVPPALTWNERPLATDPGAEPSRSPWARTVLVVLALAALAAVGALVSR